MKYNDRRNARKKKKAKTGSKKKAPSASTGVHDFDELLKRAEKAEDTFEFELAAEFYHKALEQQPNNTKVMDSMAECFLQLESANESRPWIDMARQLLNQSIALAPTENPSKWLNFAQLHEGNEALQLYSKGIEALTHALQQAAAAGAPDQQGQQQLLRGQLRNAHCAVAELYLTDLCFEPAAEEACQAAVDAALAHDDPAGAAPEAPQTLASLRLSQCRGAEAAAAAREALDRVERRLAAWAPAEEGEEEEKAAAASGAGGAGGEAEEPPPDVAARVALAKVALECAEHEGALYVRVARLLDSCLAEDDEHAEAWFLAGVALYKAPEADLEGALHYLEGAEGVLLRERERAGAAAEVGPGGPLALVQEQLRLVRAEGAGGGDGGGDGGGMDES